MATNVTPQYMEAEAEYKKAQTAEERLVCLRKMFARRTLSGKNIINSGQVFIIVIVKEVYSGSGTASINYNDIIGT